ncbi:unnamed protein product [Clavelina lepadiformis]|uniref:Uncharacterized protein n=1 Tax=Clavelina lepadiformis TaxID=159417 RepID=A0ABP0EVL5_CLALP
MTLLKFTLVTSMLLCQATSHEVCKLGLVCPDMELLNGYCCGSHYEDACCFAQLTIVDLWYFWVGIGLAVLVLSCILIRIWACVINRRNVYVTLTRPNHPSEVEIEDHCYGSIRYPPPYQQSQSQPIAAKDTTQVVVEGNCPSASCFRGTLNGAVGEPL